MSTAIQSRFFSRTVICFCCGLFLGIPAAVLGQTNYYTTNGTEYAIIGSLPGDQVFPDAAVTTNGGFVVWQDNVTDGDGWGVSARQLDNTLSGTLSTFRVNAQGANDQENPRVMLLKNGGAVFAWQGGVEGYQHIYARFLTPTSTWLTTTDVVVSVPTNNFQINPAVAVLNNSNVALVWASFDQAGSSSMQDVYCKILSQTGQTVSNEFLINTNTPYNQRTPAVAALKNGGFVVAWVSEQERAAVSSIDSSFYSAGGAAYVSTNENAIQASLNTNYYVSSAAAPIPSVDIYFRLYSSNGAAQGGEFLADTNSLNPCANPAVAAAADGSFMVAWSGRDLMNPTNGWDIYARTFSSAGAGGATALVNTHLPGSQYAPRISAIGTNYLIVWTSLGQDGSREGVYGRFMHGNGSPLGGEFLVNTTTAGQQMQPAVASDGISQFLAVWTGFTLTPNSFDLYAQRYINVNTVSNLPPMSAPIVTVPFVVDDYDEYQPQLVVSWATNSGIFVSSYEVYADGATNSPMALVSGATNQWMMTADNGLTASSTHWFQVAYTTPYGQSPLSAATTNKTWSDCDWGGIPCDWMRWYFGNNASKWPSPTADSDGDGMDNYQEFLAGTIPTNAASVLRVQLSKTQQGLFLNWNTQPGLTYQVQDATNFNSWGNLGSPRFAAGTNDSIYVGNSAMGYYRVSLLRQ